MNYNIKRRRQSGLNSYDKNIRRADYGERVSHDKKVLKDAVIPIHSLFKIHSKNRMRNPTFCTCKSLFLTTSVLTFYWYHGGSE